MLKVFIIALLLLSFSLSAQTLRVTGFTDQNHGIWDGTVTSSVDTTLCVYRNTNTTYRVKAYSAEGSFVVRNGANSIPYQVWFDSSRNAILQLSYNVRSSNRQRPCNTLNCVGASIDCSGKNATLQIRFVAGTLNVATTPAGVYTGTVILEVSN